LPITTGKPQQQRIIAENLWVGHGRS